MMAHGRTDHRLLMVDVGDEDELFDPFADDPFGDEPIIRPRHLGLRVLAAVLLVALIALLVLVPSGWLRHDSDPTGSPRGSDQPDSPTTAATLQDRPDARRLTDSDWQHQIGSTVLIGATSPQCSGTVTEIAGRRFVTSARHCLTDIIDERILSPEPGLAQEVTGRLSGTVRVFDPVSHRRIATLDRIAVGTGDTDLLVATTRDETGTYRAKPARSLDDWVEPTVGDEVATYASSAAVGFEPERLTGVYLGVYQLTDDEGHAYTVDLIGYRQPDSRYLVSKGHSGHASTGARGALFGPLLFSINAETSAAQRDEYLEAMGRATGIDLEAEGIVAVDEALRVTPAEYDPFATILRS
jgi:hypothetical protein